MRNIIGSLLFFLLFPIQGRLQVSLINSIQIPQPGIASVDYVSNYYIQSGNELWMINRSDTVFRKFSIISLAGLTNIDGSNALKIMLYYQTLGKILFIDNNISDFSSAISLNELDLAQSTLACTSYDNGFWVYLPNTMSLYRYDQYLNLAVEIQAINRFIKKGNIEPTFLKENANQLYLFFPEYGFLVFDVFGAYVQTIPNKVCQDPDIQSGELIYYRADSLFFQSLSDPSKVAVTTLPHHENVNSIRFSAGKAYLQAGEQLFIYKLGS